MAIEKLSNNIDIWIHKQIVAHPGIKATTLYRKAKFPESLVEESLYRLISLGLIHAVNKRWYPYYPVLLLP